MQAPWWRPAVAEFIGVMALVFIGAGSIVALAHANALAGGGQGLMVTLGAALAHGLTIAVMVTGLGHLSGGHFNPAVTIAAMLTRRITPFLGLSYVVAQIVGGIAGAALLVTALPADWWRAVALGTPAVAAAMDPGKAILVEAVCTFFLVIVIFGVGMDDRNASRVTAGLAIGLTITALILMAGFLTGAAFNPARAFATALLSGSWGYHHVYWLGPIAGAAVAGLLYDTAFVESRAKPAGIPPSPAPETVPPPTPPSS